MIPIALLFLGGLLLSAFFSGSETGFYRVTRVRLVIDGIGG
ncbi:MAG TPA: hemolysin protein, partial [Planctomycetaceae bacterium]|nr:hemolysin protein [Planctomycetaceae bacterium]